MPQMRTVPKPLTCCWCGEPFEVDDDVRWLTDDQARHVRDCPEWKPSGPVSDGTLRCPKRSGDLPCQKRIPTGWHENEGHAGGHWFEPDDSFEARRTGQVHVDAGALLAMLPYDEHPASNCPGPDSCPTAAHA